MENPLEHPLVKEAIEKIKGGYFFLEDKYYSVLDKINKTVPIYKVIDPIDKVVPSFALLIGFVFFILLLFILMSFSSVVSFATLQVVDSRGELVDGVSIDLTLSGQTKLLSTDDWGEAQVEIPGVAVKVDAIFSKDGFRDLEKTLTLTADEITSVTLQIKDITLDPGTIGGSKTIKVVDNSTNRLITKEVTVSFECSGGALSPQTQTGSTGEFEVSQPSNCSTLIATAEADGYTKKSKTLASKVNYIILTTNVANTTGSITTIVKDTLGEAIPDVVVRAIDEERNVEAATSSTSLGGSASLQGLNPGDYTVSIIAPDGRTAQKTGVSVNVGQTTTVNLELPLKNQADIKKIYLELIEQGTTDPVSTAQVFIYHEDVLIDSTTSDSLGIVNKSLTDPGTGYLLVITHSDFITKIEPNIPLKELYDSNPISVPMVRAQIEDPNPTSAEIIATVVDEDLKPVKDALISIYDSEYPTIPLKAPPGITLEGGTFTFVNLAPGSYIAKARDEDGKAEGESDLGTVAAGSTLELQVILVLGSGTVEAKIFDDDSADDTPIVGAGVDFIDAADGTTVLASCITDADGKCESEPIPADKFVYTKASATGFLPSSSVSVVDIVNKGTAKISVGLIHESSLPPGIGDIDSRFKYFCEDPDCDKIATRIKSDAIGIKTYFAKFELLFTKDEAYTGTVQHVRIGPDSEIDLPLPNDYKAKILGATGPFLNDAPLSNCWNNDPDDPFMEPTAPVDCSTGLDAKQVNLYYPDFEGKQIIPLVVEFSVEPGLEDGTRLEMHYKAKTTTGETEVVTANKVKYFLIDEVFCDGTNFSWSFVLENPDGSTTVLDRDSDAENPLEMNESYNIFYQIYNCSNRNFTQANVTFENDPLELEAVSLTAGSPYDFGPSNAFSAENFAFQNETEISHNLPVFSVTEAPSVDLRFFIGTESLNSEEILNFKIESNKNLTVTHTPINLPSFGNPDLSGKVADALDTVPGLENALISLIIGDTTRTTTTNEAGQFNIENIEQLDSITSVTLQVRKAGFKTFEKEIDVGSVIIVPNASLDCLEIEKDASPDVIINFVRNVSGSGTFTLKSDCSAETVVILQSELKVSPSDEFTLAAGASREITVEAETIANTAKMTIGEYGVSIMARFATDDPLAGFAGPLKTARIYVTDPDSCFRLADPSTPSDPGVMKSSYDIRDGLDEGIIVNECFVYFEDLTMPRLDKLQDFSAAEGAFSLLYEPLTLNPGEAVEKQIILDANQVEFNEDNRFIFDVVNNSGYVFVDWVDFFMTDAEHTSGVRHMVLGQTHRNVWSNYTSELPYTPFQNDSSGSPEPLPNPTHPVVDNLGWVDTETYYKAGSLFADELTPQPIWQGQHNVCNNFLGGFDSTFGTCSVDNYYRGANLTPYIVGDVINKVALEIPESRTPTTNLSAIRWHYTRTDQSHDGKVDFKVRNNNLMGESYALIEVEDTTGTFFVPDDGGTASGDIVVNWTLSKRGVLRNTSNLLDQLSETVTIAPGEVLGVSVESGLSNVFGSIASVYSALKPSASKELIEIRITTSAGQPPILMENGDGNLMFYEYSNGMWSSPSMFDMEFPGETDVIAFGTIHATDVIAIRNNSDRDVSFDQITLNYLTKEAQSIEIHSGEATVPLGESLISFEVPPTGGIDLPPGEYDYTEYLIEESSSEAIAYFENTLMSTSSDPYASGENIIVAISSPTEGRNTMTEQFHIRLIGQDQGQCIGQGGLTGSTGVGSKPKVMFNWDWESIDIDTCNSDNLNFIYCDPTQFTVSLMKRLELMRTLAEEDLGANLLTLRELQEFDVYLIEDAYVDDFRNDFVDFFQGKFLSEDSGEWNLYLQDADRFVIDTSAAHLPLDPPTTPESKVVSAGLHEVYIELDFDQDLFDFFYIQDQTDLIANITVYISKVSDPIIKSPFYYMPFNGNLGQTDIGEFQRDGYGLAFSNNDEPLVLISTIGGSLYKTDSPGASTGRKTIGTVKENDFTQINKVQRGLIMQVAQDQSQVNFAPSIATPVLAEMIPKDGKVESYYYLRDDTEAIIPQSGFLNLWNGAGSTMRPMEGVCADFYGSQLQFRIQDRSPLVGSCPQNVTGVFGFTYDPATEGEQLYFESVFYTPEDQIIHLRKSCENNSTFYSPNLVHGTDTLSTPLALSIADSKTKVASMNDVINLIAEEYVCVSADTQNFSFWWNPQKVLEELDDVKLSINSDWESGMSCTVSTVES